MESSRVTLKEIAERAGVSIGTVDRALNNRPGVSERSKRRVEQIAAELGYRPNRFASALSRRSEKRIAAVFPDRPAAFYGEIERGVDRAAAELRDFGVSVEKIRYPLNIPDGAARCLSELVQSHFDGVAVNAAGLTSGAEIDALAADGTPVITFNTDLPGGRRLFFVGSDSRQSGRMACELMDMMLGGSGQVAVLGNFARTMPFLERFSGFFEQLRAQPGGMEVMRCSECPSDPAEAQRALTEAVERAPDVRGVFCTGHSSTVGAIRALKALNRRGVRLIGYDLSAETAQALREGWCDLILYQDPFAQGYQAARLLARRLLEGWSPKHPQLLMDTQVVLRSNLERYLHREFDPFGQF